MIGRCYNMVPTTEPPVLDAVSDETRRLLWSGDGAERDSPEQYLEVTKMDSIIPVEQSIRDLKKCATLRSLVWGDAKGMKEERFAIV